MLSEINWTETDTIWSSFDVAERRMIKKNMAAIAKHGKGEDMIKEYPFSAIERMHPGVLCNLKLSDMHIQYVLYPWDLLRQ